MKYNVRKRKTELGKYYKHVGKHITSLHNTKSNIEFKQKYKLVSDKWKKWKLEKFCEYFEKQWVNSTFNNWQLYSTPVGFATTNNPIE